KPAVAIDADGVAATAGQAYPDRGRDPEAHAAESRSLEEALTGLDSKGELKQLNAAARTSGDDIVAAVQFAGQNLGKVIATDRSRHPVFGQNNGVPAPPLGATLAPTRLATRKDGVSLAEHLAHEFTCIGTN